LPVLAGSAAYEVASLLARPSRQRSARVLLDSHFRVIVGIAISLTGFKPLVVPCYAVLNAVISAPVMIATLGPRLADDLHLSGAWRVLGWAAAVEMTTAAMAFCISAWTRRNRGRAISPDRCTC
jgi:hypothetical protein